MKKIKGSSIVEVIAAITILAIVFAFVAGIMSSLYQSGKSLKVLSIETEIDKLITNESINSQFKVRTIEYDGYVVEVQYDRDVSRKNIVIGLYQANTLKGNVLAKQEFVFFDKSYEK